VSTTPQLEPTQTGIREIKIAHSPDSDDAFMFYGLATNKVRVPGLKFTHTLTDIETLNQKAIHEAKIHTSWVNPNYAYDQAVCDFIEHILARFGPNPFLADFLPFHREIARYGVYNSLSQVLLKIAAPGIPDFYQGSELWDFSLVDPDNRRPVDYGTRTGFLEDCQHLCVIQGSNQRQLVQDMLATVSDGRIKLYITMVGLHYRRTHAPLFLSGEYVPLKVEGTKKRHVCAFARIYEDQAVVAVVPILVKGLCQETEMFPFGPSVWEDTWVIVPSWRPASCYQNLLTGEILSSTETEGKQSLRLAEVMGSCPVALLERVT